MDSIGTNGKAPEDETKLAYFRPQGFPIELSSDPCIESITIAYLILSILSNDLNSYHFVFFVYFMVLLNIFSAPSAFSAVQSFSLPDACCQLEAADLSEKPTFSLDTLMKNTPMITSTVRVRKWSKIA